MPMTMDGATSRATARALTPAHVASDPALRQQLRRLRELTAGRPGSASIEHQRKSESAFAAAREHQLAADVALSAARAHQYAATSRPSTAVDMAGMARRSLDSRMTMFGPMTTPRRGAPHPTHLAERRVPRVEIERALNYLAPTHVVQDTVLLNALKVLKERTNALGPSGAARRDPPSLGFRPLSSFRSPTSSTLSSTHPF